MIIKGFKVIFGFFLLYFGALLLHYHYYLMTFPYPIIYREGASMAITTLMLHGIKPFSYILEPQYINIYGIVYPLFALPLVKLYGNNLVVYRALTAFFIYACCFVVSLVLYKKKTPLLLNCWATLALYASLLYPLTTTPCVDPASTGLFFMLLTIFIPFLFEYTFFSLFVSVCCGVVAFYTKPYFILGLLVMASYLFFFISKKKSLVFGCWCLILSAFSAALMDHYFPNYLNDCFFIHFNSLTENIMNVVLERQVHEFLNLNSGMFLFITILSIYVVWKKDLKDLLAGLTLVMYAGIFFTAVLVLLMGRKFGANLWYFFQLLSPFLVIFIARIMGQFSWWPVVFSGLLIYNLFSLTSDDDYKYFSKSARGVPGWQEIEKLVRSNNCIFNTPLTAPLLIKNDKEIFDDGHMPFFWLPTIHKRKFDCSEMIYNYLIKVQKMTEKKEFDFILLEAGYYSWLLPDSFRVNYKNIGSVFVYAPQDRRPYSITIWRPK